jgi:hypothetical protein
MVMNYLLDPIVIIKLTSLILFVNKNFLSTFKVNEDTFFHAEFQYTYIPEYIRCRSSNLWVDITLKRFK